MSKHWNAPGKPSIEFRIGNQPQLFDALKGRISQFRVPTSTLADQGKIETLGPRVLAPLATRDLSDPTIALLDAWALVGDVLTFYQEKIANEGYLRTSKERLSVLELARQIGYDLNPGSAATATMRFDVDFNPKGSGVAFVTAGTRVQSVPDQGELPQTFETSTDAEMRLEWNELRPQLTTPQVLVNSATVVYLAGNIDLKPGTKLLIVTESGGKPNPTVKVVTTTSYDDVRKVTTVHLGPPAPPAPVFPMMHLIIVQPFLITTKMKVDTLTPILKQTFRDRDLGSMVGIASWHKKSMVKYAEIYRQIVPKVVVPPPPAGPDVVAMPPVDTGLFAFRVSAGMFGHNAPLWDTFVPPEGVSKPETWEGKDIGRRTKTGERYEQFSGQPSCFLERVVPDLVQGQWTLISSAAGGTTPFRIASVVERSLAEFTMTGKATGLRLVDNDNKEAVSAAKSELAPFKIRETTASVASYELTLAPLEVTAPVGQGSELDRIVLETMVLDIPAGRPIVLTGERLDLPGVVQSEGLILKEATHAEGRTTLIFTTPLQHPYVRKTVTLHANVVMATHGETVPAEILGHGDGSRVHQSFVLRTKPLTFVPASTPTGSTTTLEVRVNGVLWRSAPNLWGATAVDRVYTTQTSDEGDVKIIFGDGKRGGRLPTGLNNVVAKYRKGVGAPGRLAADRLTLLPSRPANVRTVTNPLPTEGGTDPETRDMAKSNAPRTVLTFGRIISRRDLEDFARGFSGVGKAQAQELLRGEHRWLLLTVASVQEKPLSPTDDTWLKLVAAIEAAKEPAVRVKLISYQSRLFVFKARIRRDPSMLFEPVREACVAALRAMSGFGARDFGQSATLAEAVAVVQRTAGVLAVDVDQFSFFDAPAGLSPLLVSRTAEWSGTVPTPGELVTIHPLDIEITEGL